MKYINTIWLIIKFLVKRYCALVGGLWTAMEILAAAFQDNATICSLHNNAWFYVLVPMLLAVIISASQFRFKEKIDTKSIEIRYGDILKCKGGSIVLGINHQGISDLSSISAGSIHGQLMKKYGEDEVKAAIQADKDDIVKYKPERTGQDFLMIKMSNINEHGIAESSDKQVREAIHKLFWHQHQYDVVNNTLYMPLLGTGTAGINLSKQDILQTIIKEFICMQKDKSILRDVISHLVIVIYWKDIDDINPEKAVECLKRYSKYCSKCDGIDVCT